jgi:hypothetical protein
MTAVHYCTSGFANPVEERERGQKLLLKVKILPSARGRQTELVEDALRSGTYKVKSLPSGSLIQLTGVLLVDQLKVPRQHTGNHWRFSKYDNREC